MFSSILKSSRSPLQSFLRTVSIKPPPPQYRSISPQLRFHRDTKAIFGLQRAIRTKRPSTPSDFDLVTINPKKTLFEKDTELLYGSSEGLHRARSVPKGVPISERSRYLRQLFRIPRGQPASLFPEAYIPNKYLGLRRKKEK